MSEFIKGLENIDNLKFMFKNAKDELTSLLTNSKLKNKTNLSQIQVENLQIKIENKETENEILKQQLQMYKE